MKPEVRLQITPDIYAVFNTVEEIDDLSEILDSCRADLEHQIEMERQRREDKRNRRRNRKEAQKNENREKTCSEYEKLKKEMQGNEILAGFFSQLSEIYDAAFGRIKDKK